MTGSAPGYGRWPSNTALSSESSLSTPLTASSCPTSTGPQRFAPFLLHTNRLGWWQWRPWLSGTPVAATRVGGLASTITHGKTGFLVGSRQPEGFASAIERLLGDEALRQRMGAAAAAEMAVFSWRSVAQSILGGIRGPAERARHCWRATRFLLPGHGGVPCLVAAS